MAIITFMSDFGLRDHYVASVKAKILSFSHNLKIVDITHHIEPLNISHGAYVLGSVFRDFPKGTVHLVCVDSSGGNKDRLLAMKLEDHFFVGNDNGIFSLISDKASHVIELKKDITNNNFHPTFTEKTTLAAAAAALANEMSIYNLGPQVTDVKVMLNRMVRIEKDKLFGNVIHIDNYGNAITNITKSIFEEARKDRKFLITTFTRDEFATITENYQDVDRGENMAIFNGAGHLEICIRNGKASQLLGMSYDTPVNVSFQDV